jgi:hypothetical protein
MGWTHLWTRESHVFARVPMCTFKRTPAFGWPFSLPGLGPLLPLATGLFLLLSLDLRMSGSLGQLIDVSYCTGIPGIPSAIAMQVIVLQCPADRCSSPYKSLMLKWLTLLPQTPSIKKDQVNAVRTFHPGTTLVVSSSGFLILNLLSYLWQLRLQLTLPTYVAALRRMLIRLSSRLELQKRMEKKSRGGWWGRYSLRRWNSHHRKSLKEKKTSTNSLGPPLIRLA